MGRGPEKNRVRFFGENVTVLRVFNRQGSGLMSRGQGSKNRDFFDGFFPLVRPSGGTMV